MTIAPDKCNAVSLTLSLQNRADIASVVNELRSLTSRHAGSVALSVRGSGSAMLSILHGLGDQAVDVSARLSLKGNIPAKV